jgi:uncharacterized protein DUF2510
MNERKQAGAVALIGAVVLGLGCWLPYESSDGIDYEIFQRHQPHAVLYFAVEPAAVMVVAAVLGVLLMRAPLHVAFAGALIAMGCQTALMWVGYLGNSLTSDFGGHVKAGGWIGLLGSLVIASAGLIALRASSTPAGTAQPAGWYDDPEEPARLRYWSGSTWTEHTSERPAAG